MCEILRFLEMKLMIREREREGDLLHLKFSLSEGSSFMGGGEEEWGLEGSHFRGLIT